MIVVAGSDSFQINPIALTELERDILREKRRSPVVYRYPSLDALEFELKMRYHIVEAAKAMYASGVSFATFDESRSNERLWIRTANGGFQLRRGVLPSEGINDIFINGELYAFECAGAIIIMLYKAALDTLGDAEFNAHFQNLYLRDWQHDRDLSLITTSNLDEAYAGDVLYFKNPDHDPETPEWQGENVVKLDDNLYFGHGIGIESGQDMIAALNRMRRPGSRVSAYLQDLVVHPDFEALRMLFFRDAFQA
ncbi:protein-glutamine gamma-glutamyltransferase [Paenibacillus arenilitoris]|uniref:Protein-glutamine gamma-glutamyltransferase n=1 Tax=Paenibacillus arenilitoris TaxID=2772299 RepID=A0A927CNI5_9BACL|nr:protein-glutamine gamma-glutamyltransferase [Paenibacillus arenilitoris]MBD2871333.1 protein-glutamine gamma-glutamyltransferase [Paenibacillus arenilitoris]